MPYIFMEVAVVIVLLVLLKKLHDWIILPMVNSWCKKADPSDLQAQLDKAKAEAKLLAKQTEIEIQQKREVQKQLDEITGSRPNPNSRR